MDIKAKQKDLEEKLKKVIDDREVVKKQINNAQNFLGELFISERQLMAQLELLKEMDDNK